MEWIAAGILFLVFVLWMFARSETVPDTCKASAVTKPFFQMAVFLHRKLSDPGEGGSLRTKLKQLLFRKNEENLRLLDPAGDVPTVLYLQFVQKTGIALLLLTVGLLFCLLVSYSESQDTLLENGNTLGRREFGKGNYEVELTAVVQERDKDAEGVVQEETIDIEVLQRSYTEEELQEMLPEFESALEKAVLAKNESADRVCSDLNLVDALEAYPFSVSWEYSDHSLIRPQGQLKEEIPEEGALLTLDARIGCDRFEAHHCFSVMVWPKEKNGSEKIRESILEALRASDENSRTSDILRLPEEADGITILWREEKKNSFLLLLVLVLVATVAVWWGKDHDLERQVKERDAQMTEDYPEVISKLALYVGAGMTVRLAWKKLTAEYLNKQNTEKSGKRFVYEEMVLTMREMESGVSELQAYRHFAKRARLQKYVKLVSLLEQNVKLGAKGFLESLRKETEEALEERRSRAKTLGEEAGTKLLVPMILMLAIVMVVIIVPAFMSI